MKRINPSQRLVWAVETLAVAPTDRLLEIGCGQGIAVELVCEKLHCGSIKAIDRSASMISRAQKKNAAYLTNGMASFQVAPLHQADLADARFDKIFAINVSLFWWQRPDRELTLVKKHLAPQGRFFLFHEPPPGSSSEAIPTNLPALLEDNGFIITERLEQELSRTRIGCVIAKSR